MSARKFNAARASLDLMREMGYAADLVERRNRYGSLDFLGFADVVGIARNGSPLAVQATMEGKVKNRLDKMKALSSGAGSFSPGPLQWLDAGGLIFVMGWGKVKRVRGGTAFRWECKRKAQVTRADLTEEEAGGAR